VSFQNCFSRRTKRTVILLLVTVLLACSIASPQDANVVVTTGPVSMVRGNSRIQPEGGQAGFGVGYNYLPYELPGQYADPNTNSVAPDQVDSNPRDQRRLWENPAGPDCLFLRSVTRAEGSLFLLAIGTAGFGRRFRKASQTVSSGSNSGAARAPHLW
jgi:hypothetical protein